MTNVKRGREAREKRRTGAQKRQEERSRRSDAEQVKLLNDRPGKSERERVRLLTNTKKSKKSKGAA